MRFESLGTTSLYKASQLEVVSDRLSNVSSIHYQRRLAFSLLQLKFVHVRPVKLHISDSGIARFLCYSIQCTNPELFLLGIDDSYENECYFCQLNWI